MSEIQDLKNHIMALNEKINTILLMIQNFNKNNDNINELVNMIHNLGFERSKQNVLIYETMLPDIIRRITVLEKPCTDQEANKKSDDRLFWSIHKLGLLQRTANVLNAENIKTVGDLISCTERSLRLLPNFGMKSWKDLSGALEKIGMELAKEKQR